MKRSISAAAAILLALALSAPAFAQHTGTRGAFRWDIGAGASITTGTMNRYLNDGWIVSGGVSWQPDPLVPLALRLGAHYSDYNATRELIHLGSLATRTRIDDGEGSTLGLDLNLMYHVPLGSWLRGYTSVGVGVDRRRIDLTQTWLFTGYACDPWWGWCGLSVFPGDTLIARTSSTHFAWNAGLGLEFPTTGGTWFVQATYHRIETREPTEYVPIEFGIRF